jgi:hypothetical protein
MEEMLREKIIQYLFNLSKSSAFKRLLKRYSFEDPVQIINAYNRHYGFHVSGNDFSINDKHMPRENDHALLNRICDAYILSKKFQPASGTYSVDGMWKDILNIHYKKLVEATVKKDFRELHGYLDNLFRKGTYGLGMSGAMPDTSDPQKMELYINNYIDCILRLALYLDIPCVRKDMDNEYFVFENKLHPSELFGKICEVLDIEPTYPFIGNPFGLKIEGKSGQHIIPIVAYRHLYTAMKVKEIIDTCHGDSIVEIGGGFGGVLYYIASLSKRPLNLTSLDIPEINIISSYFLSKALPGLAIHFYGEDGLERAKNGNAGLSILPNWEMNRIPSNTIDVVLNTDSFPELPEKTVMEYLRKVSDISRYFYSFNQDCGTHGQTRLSQLNMNDYGLRCIQHSIAWMRRGYFERVYCSVKNSSAPSQTASCNECTDRQ